MVVPTERRINTAKASPIFGSVTVLEVTLSVPAEAVDDNDVLADTQILSAAAFLETNGSALIHSVQVIDKADQGVEMDLVFLTADQSLGTEDSAVDITDTESEDIAAVVNVPSTAYVDLIGSQQAFVTNIGQAIKGPSDSQSLWIGAITRGTPTYAADSLIVRVGLVY